MLARASIAVRLLLALVMGVGTSLPALSTMLCSGDRCGGACPMHAPAPRTCCAEKAATKRSGSCKCSLRSWTETVQLHAAPAPAPETHVVLDLPPAGLPALSAAAVVDAVPEIDPREQSPPGPERAPDLGRAPPRA